MTLRKAIRGAATVVRRRGPAYLGYLVTGVGVPRLSYRYVWGPRAASPLRSAFDVVARSLTRPAAREDLAQLAVVADGPSNTVASGAAVEALLERLHSAGLTGLRHHLDEIVVTPAGDAALRSAARLRRHRRRDIVFHAERDADRRAVNARYVGGLLTEDGVRRLLRLAKSRVTNGYKDYAPIDFGGGLTIGDFVKTDSGTGRWDFFNGRIVAPLVAGRRVLDLGSNNGSLPLMMLRAGAREVVGIEGDPAIAEFARLNTRILAWRDMRTYAVRIVTGDMRLLLTDDLGRFDVVTAFCSLYYLPLSDMQRVVEAAASMGATLILQANESIDNLPAHASALEDVMRQHGYADIEVHRYPGFGRPLLVGRSLHQQAEAHAAGRAQLARA